MQSIQLGWSNSAGVVQFGAERKLSLAQGCVARAARSACHLMRSVSATLLNGGCFIAAVVGMAGLLTASAFGQTVPPDRCIEDGGTAICRAPEVSQFSYSYCDSEQLCASGFRSEEAAVEDLRLRVHNTYRLCESYVERPGFAELPAELALLGQGNQNVPDGCVASSGTAPCRNMDWTRGVERRQRQLNRQHPRG